MRHLSAIALVLLTLPCTTARADELSARQIIDRSLERNFFGFENAEAHISMLLTSRGGTTRTRELLIRSRKTEKNLGQTLLRFTGPADIAGTTFLVHEHAAADDDQFLYLPALGKVRRISSNQRTQRFVGTDFTYGDMQSRALRQGQLSRLLDADVAGQAVFVIQAFPPPEEKSQYSRVVAYIHQRSFIPMRMLFYAPDDSLHKEMTVYKVQRHDGRWVVMDSSMRDDKRGSSTRLMVTSLDTSINLVSEDFTQAAMTR